MKYINYIMYKMIQIKNAAGGSFRILTLTFKVGILVWVFRPKVGIKYQPLTGVVYVE